MYLHEPFPLRLPTVKPWGVAFSSPVERQDASYTLFWLILASWRLHCAVAYSNRLIRVSVEQWRTFVFSLSAFIA